MGVTVSLALLFIGLAYLAQSPRWLARLGLSGYRLDLQVRALTGYAFACLLLLVGFFLAGVPLGGETAVSPVLTEIAFEPAPIETSEAAEAAIVAEPPAQTDSEAVAVPTEIEANIEAGATETPSTGAFIPEPTSTATPDSTNTPAPTDVPATDVPAETNTPTSVPTDVPTTLPTETATSTPTPTLTPTPIVGETAVVNTGSSTVWTRRTPGGQNLVVLQGGDVVILLSGHANRASTLWQEVRTVEGVVGWIEEDYLSIENE